MNPLPFKNGPFEQVETVVSPGALKGPFKYLSGLLLVGFLALSLAQCGGGGGGGGGTETANAKPFAMITSPGDGSAYIEGESVSFSGTGTDPEDGALTGASLTWTSSIDGEIGTGTAFSESGLSLGAHTITLIATDSEGSTTSVSVTITVMPNINTSPTAAINSPSDRSEYVLGETVSFSGTATDPEEGVLSGAALVWTSSIDGVIGTGTAFSKNDLALGFHTITLIATDSTGASGNDSVGISVTTTVNAPPAAVIIHPRSGSTNVEGTAVVFKGTGTDPEDGVLSGASLVWTSSIDGQTGTGTFFTRKDLSLGAHTITLVATDSEGATGTDTAGLTIVEQGNAPPRATITSPSEGSTYTIGDLIAFAGNATDPEDGALTGASLVWTSSIDGQIGTGTTFSRNDLSLGAHEITFRATDSEGATDRDTADITVNPIGGGGGDVTISGTITFDFVPAVQPGGLDYSNTSARPVRGAVLEAINSADSSILDTATTDASGTYSVTVPPETNVFIRVWARMLKTGAPSWDFQVVDNTSGKAIYVMDGAPFNSGTIDITGKDLNAASGWGGSSYTSARTAGPFAILDTVYKASGKVAGVAPTVAMPGLLINWSVNNAPVSGNKALGQIGTSHYDNAEKQLYILGLANNDTDEHDDHVMAHEWAHYFEDRFSRTDSLGGSHGVGSRLDPRVSFGEGFSNAFSGIATDDPLYVDTAGPSQGLVAVFLNLEDNGFDESVEGWFSEVSVHAILYDLYDSANDGVDSVTMGFAPIYNVCTNGQKNADSFTTIFSFISFLKAGNPGSVAPINSLLAGESITASAVDEWDSTETETNDGGAAKALPVYSLLVDGVASEELCSSGAYGNYNKLTTRKFFYFRITSTGSYTITAVPDIDGDPVITLFSNGALLAVRDAGGNGATENLTRTLTPGYYVGEVYEWWHVNGSYATQECFSVTLD